MVDLLFIKTSEAIYYLDVNRNFVLHLFLNILLLIEFLLVKLIENNLIFNMDRNISNLIKLS